MDHISYVSLALRGSSMENGDALRLGLPFHLDAYLEPVHGQRLPCRRFSYFPFHGPLGVCEYSFEPAFIRKRNERERHRVRCVNEGYARLREHLPQELEEKRLSKVETLRAAIDYIKHLQSLLDLNVSGMEVSPGNARNRVSLPPGTEWNDDGGSKAGPKDSGEIIFWFLHFFVIYSTFIQKWGNGWLTLFCSLILCRLFTWKDLKILKMTEDHFGLHSFLGNEPLTKQWVHGPFRQIYTE